MSGPYLAGQLVRMANYSGSGATLSGGFRDVTGALVDPTTVLLTYKPPNAAKITYTYGGGQIIKDGVGLYHYDQDTTGEAGIWTYEWSAPDQTLAANSFQVLQAPL